METLQSIGIREFRENLHKYTAVAQEPFAVTSHGRPIGYYVPAQQTPAKADFEALKNAAKKLQQMMQDIGMTEDEAIEQFNTIRRHDRKSAAI